MTWLDEPAPFSSKDEFRRTFRFSVQCELKRRGCDFRQLPEATDVAIRDYAVPFLLFCGERSLTRRLYAEAVQHSAAGAMGKLHLIH